MIENSNFLLLTLDIKMGPSITEEKIISQTDVSHGVWAIHGRGVSRINFKVGGEKQEIQCAAYALLCCTRDTRKYNVSLYVIQIIRQRS